MTEKMEKNTTKEEGRSYEGYRSGFVALLGEPNVGKSTLVNAVLDFKLSIVSPKPQTTRDRIFGIYSDDDCQIVFVDTPGVMEPHDRFNEYLRDNALQALDGADVVYHMIDAARPLPLPELAREAFARVRKPRFLVVNKSEHLFGATEQSRTAELLEKINLPFDASVYNEVHFISALERVGLKSLIASTRLLLPESPPLYDPEQMTDRDMRFLAAEIVREKLLANTAQEVPYAVAVRTEAFEENPGRKHLVRVVIYVEQESQKPIIIGQGGAMLRKIGSEARPEIEAMADHAVFLELWVKVRRNWRKKEAALHEFGYEVKEKSEKRRRK